MGRKGHSQERVAAEPSSFQDAIGDQQAVAVAILQKRRREDADFDTEQTAQTCSSRPFALLECPKSTFDVLQHAPAHSSLFAALPPETWQLATRKFLPLPSVKRARVASGDASPERSRRTPKAPSPPLGVLSEDEVLSRSFHMDDVPPQGGYHRDGEVAHSKDGWAASGHRNVVCSRCCVEMGADGDIACLGCLSRMEGS
ncbi:unnamed protein product [Parascedosporium putredinis]|uniref:Uncharacterized protein n=1 Tax=Parascedosporium putredinis TaxID=1442378 RepID=A0A9P1H5Q0_9PEZI|nr:unnamed protein product [Parascedosporium putredinis]CAI7998123.1 unnamed protein product [Parascedosporium putredinis]